MSTTAYTGNRALSSTDGRTWEQGGRGKDGYALPRTSHWPTEEEERKSVVKLVVGELEDEGAPGEWDDVVTMLKDVKAHFPRLTHLYVWGIEEVPEIGGLPEKLEVLDVRKCPAISQVDFIPQGVKELVLGELPELTFVPSVDLFPVLDDLEIASCPQLPSEEGEVAAWPVQVMTAAPVVRKVNLSGHPGIKSIQQWGEEIIDLRLNDCPHLNELPTWWPVALRRLELRGAVRVKALEDFPALADYVDLGGMEALAFLPKLPPKLRTLFLYGSGVLMPPASEHGSSSSQNVAQSTRSFFEEVERYGRGEVMRCKTLILGNGEAGKTCLSQALNPEGKPSEDWDSTHGVQFDSWEFEARVEGKRRNVDCHIWDFGGQDIYHNTHRLFMEKGAVFVIVWKPEQDGKKAVIDDNGYQDDWRPLKYWFDFIKMACPHRPEILIACSHQEAADEELIMRAVEQLGTPEEAGYALFFVDSLHRGGEFHQMKKSLEDAIVATIERQGTGVPAHWEVAQEMAKGWLNDLQGQKNPSLEKLYTTVERFGQDLQAYLGEEPFRKESSSFLSSILLQIATIRAVVRPLKVPIFYPSWLSLKKEKELRFLVTPLF